MVVIWFNPEKNIYEKGRMADFDEVVESSLEPERFEVLYEFNQTSQQLAGKVLRALNLALESRLQYA